MKATEDQKQELTRRMKYGQLPRILRSLWLNLSRDQAEQILVEARQTAPMTYITVDQDTKTRLLSIDSNFKIFSSDFKTLDLQTARKIETILRSNGAMSMANYLKNSADATEKQRQTISKLMDDGYLDYINPKAWINLNRITARKMIAAGLRNEKNEKKVRHV